MPTAKIMVINADDGPGTAVAPHLTTARANAHAKGARTFGYIYTKWANSRPDPRHGNTYSRTLAAIKAEIDTWFRFYPKLNGIFLDEVTGGSTSCDTARDFYGPIYTYIKKRYPEATVIINPGGAVDSCYLAVGDIVVTFEGSFARYAGAWSGADRGWETPGNARRIWHIVHTTSATQLRTALDLSRARNAGYVYVTHLTADPNVNTFGALPPYFSDQVANVSAYQGGAGGSSTMLSRWSASNDGVNARYSLHFSQPFSLYRVYIDSDQSTATGYRVAGIGADYMLENAGLYAHSGSGRNWTAIGSSGQRTTSNSVSWTIPRASIKESGFPNASFLAFQAKTKPDPVQTSAMYEHVFSSADGGIRSYFAENDANNVYYQANFATPFTYQHVFIDTDARASTGYAFGEIGADYMIENSTLFRSTGRGWAWTPVGSVAGTGGATGVRSWTVPRSALGETAASGELANIVFNGSGGQPETSTPVYRHAYTQ